MGDPIDIPLHGVDVEILPVVVHQSLHDLMLDNIIPLVRMLLSQQQLLKDWSFSYLGNHRRTLQLAREGGSLDTHQYPDKPGQGSQWPGR